MKDTSMRKAVWSLLQKGETTVNKLHKETKYNIIRISNYIRVLYNTGYIEAETPHTKILHSTIIKLTNNTGAEAPAFYRGILTDYNTIEEIVVQEYKGKPYTTKKHKNLIPIVEALLKIGEKKIVNMDLVEKLGKGHTPLNRWKPILLEFSVLQDTGEEVRNSRLFNVDLEKVERLLSLLHKYRNHKLAFMALKVKG